MVIGQGHTYLKPVNLLKIQISSFILTEGVHIRHNVCITYVMVWMGGGGSGIHCSLKI